MQHFISYRVNKLNKLFVLIWQHLAKNLKICSLIQMLVPITTKILDSLATTS